MTDTVVLRTLRHAEARMLARRASPAGPAVQDAVARALSETLADDGGDAVLHDLATAGAAIAAAVMTHGEGFAPGAEPAYHDRHHQAEATLAAGWLARAAHGAGLMGSRQAGLCVLALAGHDLLHDGNEAHPPGTLERRSAAVTVALAGSLPPGDRAEIARLILLTDPAAPAPDDLAGRLVREADLFASLTPCLGWRLSRALVRERERAFLPGAASAGTHAGRFALLSSVPQMTPPAIALGLDAVRSLQLDALEHAGGVTTLDTLPAEEAWRRWTEALSALGLPDLPRDITA